MNLSSVSSAPPSWQPPKSVKNYTSLQKRRSDLTLPRRSSGRGHPRQHPLLPHRRWAWTKHLCQTSLAQFLKLFDQSMARWGLTAAASPHKLCVCAYSLKRIFTSLILKHIAGLRSLRCLKRELQILLNIWPTKFLHILSEACTRTTVLFVLLMTLDRSSEELWSTESFRLSLKVQKGLGCGCTT